MSHFEIAVKDVTIEGRHGPLTVRSYEPAEVISAATVVWLHGGAFAWGDLDGPESHAVASGLAHAGHAVIAVDYPLVPPTSWFRKPRPGTLPGVRFPVPVDGVVDAVLWAQARTPSGDVVLGGASAGACLAAGTTLRLLTEGRRIPTSLMLAYGTFHADLPAPSPELKRRLRGRHGLGQFTPGVVEKMNRNYAGSLEKMRDPQAFPGGADLKGFPRTLLLDADRDALRASGDAFAAELAMAGVAVDHRIVPGSRHGFLNKPGKPPYLLGMNLLRDWLAPAGQSTAQAATADRDPR